MTTRIPWRFGVLRWKDYPAIFDPFSVARDFRDRAMFSSRDVKPSVVQRLFPELQQHQDHEGNVFVAKNRRDLRIFINEPELYRLARLGDAYAHHDLGFLLGYPECCTRADRSEEAYMVPGIPFWACSTKCAEPWIKEWDAMYQAFRAPRLFRRLFYE